MFQKRSFSRRLKNISKTNGLIQSCHMTIENHTETTKESILEIIGNRTENYHQIIKFSDESTVILTHKHHQIAIDKLSLSTEKYNQQMQYKPETFDTLVWHLTHFFQIKSQERG